MTVERVAPADAPAYPPARRIDRCRACGAHELVPIIALGDQPLANSLRREEELDAPEPRYPLDLSQCRACSLVQILDSVPPEVLFSDYPYFSSVIGALVDHARDIALRMVESERLGRDSLVV